MVVVLQSLAGGALLIGGAFVLGISIHYGIKLARCLAVMERDV